MIRKSSFDMTTQSGRKAYRVAKIRRRQEIKAKVIEQIVGAIVILAVVMVVGSADFWF